MHWILYFGYHKIKFYFKVKYQYAHQGISSQRYLLIWIWWALHLVTKLYAKPSFVSDDKSFMSTTDIIVLICMDVLY